jgi:hypothetical protein
VEAALRRRILTMARFEVIFDTENTNPVVVEADYYECLERSADFLVVENSRHRKVATAQHFLLIREVK